jgi:chromatin remodeling complex protein RSC6
MVRASKTDKQAVAPAPEKTVKAEKPEKKEKKAKAAVEAAPVTPAPEPAPANEVVETSDSLAVKMTEFGAKLQQVFTIFSSIKGDFKTLERSVAREMKAAQKASSKKTKRSGNRAPSGFVKPTRISDELASFLGKASGTEMARTEVSREINAYIRANKLQDKENGRKIHPDAKLGALLKTKSSDELTYFNLQRFMKHHFIKLEAAATV